ncbi:MAG: anthranilate synthase component II [Chitinophagales bacterium]
MVLLVDNYDSFTYNLYDYICQSGKKCKVIRNDEMSIEEIKKLAFSSIVISPGPEIPKKAGISMEIIDFFHDKKPILGVCLGHQALGEYFGAELVKAIQPMHGKTSLISSTENHFLFEKIDMPMQVMRYHSLVLKNLKSPLRILAKTDEGEIMAIAHKTLPLLGVQFHPESILTKDGLQLIKNWIYSIR